MLSKLFFTVDIFSMNASRDKREIYLRSSGSKIYIGTPPDKFYADRKANYKTGMVADRSCHSSCGSCEITRSCETSSYLSRCIMAGMTVNDTSKRDIVKITRSYRALSRA
jgi:hypothetical protein